MSAMFTQAINFLFLPILTRLLSVSEYGVWDVWRSFITVAFAVLTVNTYTALGRYYYEEKDDFPQFFGTSLIVSGGCILVSLIGFIIFQDQLATLTGLPVETILYLVPAVLFTTLSSWFEQILIPQKKSGKIALRNAIYSVSLLSCSVLFIWLLPAKKYMGAVYAQMLVGFIFFIYYYFELRKHFVLAFSTKHLRQFYMS